jgi:hypothetical protein
MIKQIVGIIFLLVFLSFLGNKFYDAVKDMEYASLIIFGAVLVLLIVIIGVGKQLKGY